MLRKVSTKGCARYSNTTGGPRAKSAEVMITETKPIEGASARLCSRTLGDHWTVTEPFIRVGWMVHRYVYVPGAVGMAV